MNMNISPQPEHGFIPATRDDLRAKINEWWDALSWLETLEFQTIDSIYTARGIMENMVKLFFSYYGHHENAMAQSERKIYINDTIIHFRSVNRYARITFGIELDECQVDEVLYSPASDH